MKKNAAFLTLLCLVLFSGQIFAAPPEAPIFENCEIPQITASYCGPVYHKVQAYNPNIKTDRNIRYILISGPGEIDSKTGMWSWNPQRDDTLGWFGTVEIAAMIGGNKKTMTYTECTVCGCTPAPDQWSHIAGICFDCT